MVSADLARAPLKKDGKWEGEQVEILPIRGTVTARRRLFQDSNERQDDSPALPTPIARLHQRSQTHLGPPSTGSQGVDATSLENISSLKNLFGKRVSGGPLTVPFPALRALKLTCPEAPMDNPSTAAILAIELPPLSSAQNSRRGSPILKFVPTSARGSPVQRGFPFQPCSPDAVPKLSSPLPLPPLHDGSSLSGPSIQYTAPKRSVSSKISVKSDRNSALLRANLAAKPKCSPNLQSKAQPPKPPPPRNAKTGLKAISNSKTSDNSGVVPISSVTTNYSRYNTACSPLSLKLSPSNSRSPTSSAPPLPQRRPPISNISQPSAKDKSFAALTAAVPSPTSSRILPTSPAPSNNPQPSTLLRHLTGDYVPAASLAPSRVISPAPKKSPTPPASRRGRCRGPPPPPKTCVRETMQEPPTSLHKDLNPQNKRPHLVKHHPHKHAQGERRRWRHFVTNKERKRYEELWAANTGLLLACSRSNGTTAAAAASSLVHRTESHRPHQFQHAWSSTPNYTEVLADCIDSLIVRDIWSRSRLPFDHLADVWDLVNRGEKGRLSRDEFVVGTWLVDQSLNGRKLPVSVQNEVWQSVRKLGVKTQPAN